jgi:hypothetical protein
MTNNLAKRHPREEQAAWLKILLREQITSTNDFFLYGSSSKIGSWEAVEIENFDENSDYDFAVQDSLAVYNELIKLGWQKKEELSYQDAQTVHIFEGQIGGERVQISLRVDLSRFIEAWKSIDPVFYWTFLNKRSSSFIGRDAVKTYLDQLFYLLTGVWRAPPKPSFTNLKWVVEGPAGVAGVGVQAW